MNGYLLCIRYSTLNILNINLTDDVTVPTLIFGKKPIWESILARQLE